MQPRPPPGMQLPPGTPPRPSVPPPRGPPPQGNVPNGQAMPRGPPPGSTFPPRPLAPPGHPGSAAMPPRPQMAPIPGQVPMPPGQARPPMAPLGAAPPRPMGAVPPAAPGPRPSMPPPAMQPPRGMPPTGMAPPTMPPPAMQPPRGMAPTGMAPPPRAAPPPAMQRPPPPAGMQPPPAGMQPPPAGMQPPPAGMQPPPAGMQPPPAGMQPPPAGMQPPGTQPLAAGGMRPPPGMQPPPAGGMRPPPGMPPPAGGMPPPGMQRPMPPPPGNRPPPPTTGPARPPMSAPMAPPPNISRPPYAPSVPDAHGAPPPDSTVAPGDGRPKASVQRRQYAPGEVLTDAQGTQPRPPAQAVSQPSAPGAPQAPANSGTNRIDPSQIPRPDAGRRAEKWSARANVGQCPPPASSAYIVEDDGNCSPRYMRLTLSQIINTSEALTNSGIPFAVIAQPLAEVPAVEGAVPVVDCGDIGPVRCERCRAYVNPFFTFTEGGRSYTCNMCGFTNQTPRDYYCEIDHNGYRRDQNDRPELCRGVVEFVAPPEYQARPPRPPPIVCLVESSYSAVANGIFDTVITAIGAILPSLPAHTEIAIVTFDDGVHFFNVRPDGVVQYMSVPDNAEVCLPRPPSQLLMSVGDSLSQIDQLLKALPSLAATSQRADTALGSALQACYLLLEDTGGRLLFFQHVLPVLGPMKLQQRDDVRLYGTEKERTLFAPLDASWEDLGKKMAGKHICVSSFHFVSQSFTDVASCAVLSRMTGGQLYLYQNCVPEQRDLWAPKLEVELSRNMRRTFGYEGVMRFRCSKGLCVEQYLMGMARPGEMEVDVPGIDADHAFAVTLKHDEKLEDNGHAYVQCALLYTTGAGERRVRVLTLGLMTTSVMSSLYRHADLDALLNVTLRQSIALAAKQNMHQVREWVVNNTVKMLYTYRKMCAQPATTAAGQLILPESFKLLPLYALSLTKNGVLRAGTDVRADERSALMAQAGRMPVTSSVAFVYPRLFSLRNLDDSVGALDSDGSPTLPAALPLGVEQLGSDGAFLIEDSFNLFIYLGRSVAPDVLQDLFGISSMEGIDCSRLRINLLGNDTSLRANRLVDAVRSQRAHMFQTVRIVAPKDPLEARVLSMLTEDRAQTSMNYVEFLCHVHRQIQQKFV